MPIALPQVEIDVTEAAEDVTELLKSPSMSPAPTATVSTVKKIRRRLPGEDGPLAPAAIQRPPLTASTDVMFAAHTTILTTAVSAYAAAVASVFADFARRIETVQRQPPLWMYDPAASNYHFTSAKSSE